MMTPKNAVGWVVFHADWSGFNVFREEIDALRHAVANHMNVVLVLDGQDPRDADAAQHAAPGTAAWLRAHPREQHQGQP